ncbi:HipA family kinase [Herbidospora sp. NBRC 101105]|uniref:HipA family kinase n=1 Tax=Herbidospora sp. NBRC 101105 TaxID=3032195 RepID=UPI0024A46F2A|nr:HipA family kinase [Herbidospora sp. NBRC 101105]GLX97924.1 hypothetical protein Hesp01_58740 [Herbidospora sp. NBRC 101105]
MVVDQRSWAGLLHGRHDDFETLSVKAVVGSGNASFAGPFDVVASDNRRYFVKCLGGCPPHAQATIAIEHVVSKVGRLIDAPVCDTSLIRIPEELAGWPMAFGKLQPGIAHASVALGHAIECRQTLSDRAKDDNTRRHVGVYALWDWCFGDDPQWLHDLDHDHSCYSHDHGLYLPPNDGTIRSRYLVEAVNEPNLLPDPPDGLDPEAVERVATALDAISRDALVTVLCGVPASWPVDDNDLETLGWFLEHRAPAVADRIRRLI